jgi:putative membrane protein
MKTITDTILKLFQRTRFFFIGFFMGTADLVPGVSGGTVALLCGIYERLLQAIKTVTGEALKKLVQGKVVEAFRLVPFSFLLPLAFGILFAIFSLAHLLSWLLEEQAIYVWALFFGLVLASVYVVLLRTNLRQVSTGIGFILGAAIGWVVVGLVPMQTPFTPLAVFGAGMIAISAMILPGISGSFMLVIMGQYQHILTAVTERDVTVLGIFALGCVVGLSFFARFLSWLLSRYHAVTLAVLAGMMLGSLRKIWPWKEVVETRFDEVTGVLVPIVERNIFPHTLDTTVLLGITLSVVGFLIVFSFRRVGTASQ